MPQVGRAVARTRAALLREANMRRRHAWLDAQAGHTATMLVERDGLTGHAKNFTPLTLTAPAEPGHTLPVRLTARDGDRMIAERLDA
jgi:threonylcarbamoyladenosine tRNA methylthiotransferase MtaB